MNWAKIMCKELYRGPTSVWDLWPCGDTRLSLGDSVDTSAPGRKWCWWVFQECRIHAAAQLAVPTPMKRVNSSGFTGKDRIQLRSGQEKPERAGGRETGIWIWRRRNCKKKLPWFFSALPHSCAWRPLTKFNFFKKILLASLPSWSAHAAWLALSKGQAEGNQENQWAVAAHNRH